MIDNNKRFSVKTILVAAVSVLLLIAMSIGLVLAMPSRSVNQKAEAATTDFTTPTASEQVAVNNEIVKSWGNPTTTPTLLSGTITKDNINENTGNYWYYLNSDITANFASYLNIYGNVRIVLNGYSISGNFQIRAYYSNATVSIFDKIPGKSGTGYTYNSNAVKYYKYNSGTGGYTDYYTSVPNGTDVTSMPTFKVNTYIKVTGSAFSPNTLNTSLMALYISVYNGLCNIYGINVVGCQGIGGAVMIAAFDGGTLNLYQCTVIGNSGNSGAGAVGVYHTATVNLNYCKVYGNSTTRSFAMQPSNPEIEDKMLDIYGDVPINTTTVNMYKSNVGVISSATGIKHISLKDVDFGARTVTILLAINDPSMNIDTFFETFNGISGTIELGYDCTTNYTGNSPNLNFIVHGKDNSNSSNGAYSGYNNLTLSSSARVNTVVVSGTGQIDSGATVSQVLHDGTNGRLIDNRQNPTIDKGTAGSRSKVTVNSGANLDVLDIRAGGYLGGGVITNPTTDIGTSNSVTVSIASSVGGSFVYNGQPHTPTVTVTNKGITLTQNTDYTVAYSNNINAGTATVTVTGKGNYTGTKTATFTIAKAANPPTTPPQQVFVTQWGANLSAYANQLPSGWSWQNPNTVVNSNMTAVAVYNDTANYNNTTAQVQIVLQAQNPNNNLQDTSKVSIVVNANGVGSSFVYNGQPHTPALTVMANSILLNANTDYTVAYANNVNAGIATVTVTGIGSYYGTRSVPFTIDKAANPPTMPQGSIQVTQSGTQLGAYSNYLPQGWSWQNPNTVVNGSMTAVAVYYDTANYNNTTVTVSIVYNVVGPVLPPDNNTGGGIGGNTGGTVVVRNNSTGLIVAIVVAVGLILLILIVLLVIFLIVKKNREEREREARVTEMKRQAAMQQALLQRQEMLDRQDMARESRQLGMRRPLPPSGTGGIGGRPSGLGATRPPAPNGTRPNGLGGANGTRPTAQLPYRSNNYPPRDNRR